MLQFQIPDWCQYVRENWSSRGLFALWHDICKRKYHWQDRARNFNSIPFYHWIDYFTDENIHQGEVTIIFPASKNITRESSQWTKTKIVSLKIESQSEEGLHLAHTAMQSTCFKNTYNKSEKQQISTHMDTIDKLRILNQQNVTILEGQMSFHDKHALNVDQNTTAVHVVQHLLASTLVLNPSLPRDPDIHQWFLQKLPSLHQSSSTQLLSCYFNKADSNNA